MEKMNLTEEQKIKQEEQILRFLHGEMAKEEIISFKKELQSNEILKKQAVSMARLIKGLNSVGKETDKEITDTLSKIDYGAAEKIAHNAVNGYSKPSDISLSKRIYYSLSIAASVIIIFFVGFQYYDYKRITNLGNQYFAQTESQEFVRGGDETGAKAEIQELQRQIYSGENNDEAIQKLDSIWKISLQDTYNDYTDYAPEIGMNLAYAYLKNYDKAKALEVLAEMEKHYPSDTALGKEVRILKNRISSYF